MSGHDSGDPPASAGWLWLLLRLFSVGGVLVGVWWLAEGLSGTSRASAHDCVERYGPNAYSYGEAPGANNGHGHFCGIRVTTTTTTTTTTQPPPPPPPPPCPSGQHRHTYTGSPWCHDNHTAANNDCRTHRPNGTHEAGRHAHTDTNTCHADHPPCPEGQSRSGYDDPCLDDVTTSACAVALGTLATNPPVQRGTWTSDCNSETRLRFGTNHRALRYQFTLDAAASVTVRLESQTDPYVYLYEGHGSATPNADGDFEDDDSAGNLNSRLSNIALEAGNYTIEATTFSAGVADNFTLTITVAAATSATAPTAPSISAGCAVDLGTVDGTSVSRSGLSKSSGCSSISRRITMNSVGEYESVFLSNYIRFTLGSEQIISIDLVSSDDTYLYLLNGNGTTPTYRRQNDDGGYRLNSRMYGRLAAGSYTIEATTYSAPSSASSAATVDVYVRASDSEHGSTTYGNTCPRPSP